MRPQQPGSRRATAEDQGAESPAFEVRVRKFKSVLEAPTVDIKELKLLTHSGIPDRDGLRAVTWKVTQWLGTYFELLKSGR